MRVVREVRRRLRRGWLGLQAKLAGDSRLHEPDGTYYGPPADDGKGSEKEAEFHAARTVALAVARVA
jgi:hypothetical protein